MLTVSCLLLALWLRSTCRRVARWVVLTTGGHRTRLHLRTPNPLWSLGALAICHKAMGGVWAGAGAARWGTPMGIFHAPIPNLGL